MARRRMTPVVVSSVPPMHALRGRSCRLVCSMVTRSAPSSIVMLRLVIEARQDVAVVDVVVLALDGENRDAVVATSAAATSSCVESGFEAHRPRRRRRLQRDQRGWPSRWSRAGRRRRECPASGCFLMNARGWSAEPAWTATAHSIAACPVGQRQILHIVGHATSIAFAHVALRLRLTASCLCASSRAACRRASSRSARPCRSLPR